MVIAIDDPVTTGEDAATIAQKLARLLGAEAVRVTWQAAGDGPPTPFGQPCASGEPRGEGAARGGGRCVTGSLSGADGTLTFDARVADGDERAGRGTAMTAADLLPMIRPLSACQSPRAAAPPLTRALSAAVDQQDAGVLLLDGYARLMFANAAAQTMLDRGDGLRRNGEQLGAARPTDTPRLLAAIARVVEGGSDTEPPVALARPGRRPLLVAIVASGIARARLEECAAIVHVVDPEQERHVSIEPTCRLYGLSPVEARLACLLTDGISLADAAAAMHVRPQTARSYLKQVFLKTDTHRQAELVRLMLRSALRTPQPSRAP